MRTILHRCVKAGRWHKKQKANSFTYMFKSYSYIIIWFQDNYKNVFEKGLEL